MYTCLAVIYVGLTVSIYSSCTKCITYFTVTEKQPFSPEFTLTFFSSKMFKYILYNQVVTHVNKTTNNFLTVSRCKFIMLVEYIFMLDFSF